MEGLSQVDPSRFEGLSFIPYYRSVDTNKKLNREQLRHALSNATKDLGYKIDFKEHYEEGYKLGSVKKTKEYAGAKMELLKKFWGIDILITNCTNEEKFSVRPSGVISNGEIEEYLSKVSDYLQHPRDF